MSININKYTAEANRFVNEVHAELGDLNNLEKAGRVTVAVFHTLRDKLSTEESFHLLAQLPTILKGVYVEGWDVGRQAERTDTLRDFFSQLRNQDAAAESDFSTDDEALKGFKAVLRVLSHYISDGEMKHVKQQLPRPVAQLFETW